MADVKQFFEVELPARIQANQALASEVSAVFLFRIEGEDGGLWTVNLKDKLGVSAGDTGESDCTLECTVSDWLQIRENPMLATQFYFDGKLKVSGNVILATKLQQILA